MALSFWPRDLSPGRQSDSNQGRQRRRHSGNTRREIRTDTHGQPERAGGKAHFDFRTLRKIAGIHGDIWFRREFGNSWRRETQFVGAENVIHRYQQPLSLARLKRWRNDAEIGLAVGRCGLEDAHPRIAAAQRPANLSLISIGRLNGVPTW